MTIFEMIEPRVDCARTTDGRGGERYLTAGETFQLSQAVSLKRIADALERIDLAKPLNAYGETIGECIQGQHERGLRGIPNP